MTASPSVTAPLYLSASQLKTGQLCRRKWWFDKVAKLPTPAKGYLAFGTVLHSVCERFLEADSLGRDGNGNEVDLFPDGWTWVKDSKGNPTHQVTPSEALIIKQLVMQAIETGQLERRPEGKVEDEFRLPIGSDVQLVGYIDYRSPGRIEDHKTSKIRKYLLSEKKLKSDLQMMIYAGVELVQMRDRGEVPPDRIELVHNAYIKGKSDDFGTEESGLRQTTARVTPQQVTDFWNETVLPLIEQLRQDCTIKDPFELPKPGEGACQAFGGCQFFAICHEDESLEHYTARISKLNAKLKPTINTKKTEELTAMSLTDLLKNKAQKAVPAANAQPKVQESPPAQPDQEGPPWAVAGCPACGDSSHPGFNTHGNPCRICNLESQKAGGPTSDQYIIVQGEDGKAIWEEKETGKKGEAPVVEPPAEPEVRKSEPKPEPEPDPPSHAMPEPIAGESVDEITSTAIQPLQATRRPPSPVDLLDAMHDPVHKEPEPKKKVLAEGFTINIEEPEKRGRGRPKKKPMLLIGCAPLRVAGVSEITLIEDVLLALTIDDKKYYDYGDDVWARRDWVVKNGQGIANGLKGCIVQTVKSPDGDNLVSAIAPYCDVIRGTL